MIKAAITKADRSRLIFLGLSRANCERILEGKPILFNGAQIGLDAGIDVVIVGGEDEHAIMAELEAQGVLPAGILETHKKTAGQ